LAIPILILFYDRKRKTAFKRRQSTSPLRIRFEFSAIIVSDTIPVGIDIEKQRPKIEIIAKKFVNYEFNYLNGNSPNYMRKLTVIWCVKESLYKLFATPGMLFKEHFMVIPFMLSDEQTVAWIDFQNKKYRYNTAFLEFDGFTCAYVIPDE
jgi:4'-phosphopantetheinyl transferase